MASSLPLTSTAVIVAALLTACGGGGDTSSTSPTTGTGTTTGTTTGTSATASGVAWGTVTGYGSVIINGVHYEDNGVAITLTDDRTITGDGRARDDRNSATRAALPIGSIVRVDFDSASSVLGFKVDDSISGRVESVQAGTGVTVMGQTVRIDDTTSQYEDNVLRTGGLALAVGDQLRVQGQLDDNGSLLATYVNRLTNGGALREVKGPVAGHDGSGAFSVGGLNVTYASSTLTSDMPSGNWNGLVVEIKGTCAGSGNACGTLQASKIEPEGGLSSSSSRSQAEVEGIVQSGAADSFRLGNVTVVTNGSTRWSGGTASDFAVGVKLEAEGALANGVLTANEVSLRDGSRLEGNIVAPAVSNGVTAFSLQGLPNVLIKAHGASGLATGTHVRLRGRVAPDGTTVVATELEVRSADSRLQVRSRVSAISGTTVTLLGTAIDLGNLSSYSDSRGSSGNSVNLSRDAFLAALQVGATVKLRSNDNGVSWHEAELEAD